MSAEKTPQKEASVAPAPRKRRRRWLWIAGGICAALFLFILLIPTILSTGPVRRMVLNRVNQQLNGTAEIGSWSFGWFSGLRIDNVKIVDAAGEPVVEVKSVSSPATVSALLGSTKQLGTVVIDQPKAHVALYSDGTSNLQNLMKQVAGPTGGAGTGRPAAPAKPLGLDIVGRFEVKNGEVSVTPPGAAKAFRVVDINLISDITSLNDAILFELKALLGDERAPLTAKGDAKVMKDGVPAPDSAEVNLAVNVAGFNLASVSDVAKQFGSPVALSGALNATLDAKVRGLNSATAVGNMTLQGFGASGGPLGADTPKMERMTMDFDIARDGEKVRFNKFNLDSPILTASSSGEMAMPKPGQLPTGNLKSQASVDLAALAAQLPNTLRLQQGLTITGGHLVSASSVTTTAEGARVESAIRLEGLAATRDGRKIGLDQPITMDLKATQTAQGPRLDSLDIGASFMKGHGAGDMNKFDMEITSDLAAALEEAGKFVDLGERSGKGTATLALQLTSPQAARKQVVANAKLEGLALAGMTPRPISVPSAVLDAQALMVMGAEGALQRIIGVVAELKIGGEIVGLQAPVVTGKFTAESITPVTGQGLPVTMTGGRAEFNADLAEVVGFAVDAGLAPENIEAKGAMSASCGIAVSGGIVRVDGIAGTLKGLDVAQEGKHFIEPEITLTGNAQAEPATRSATLKDFVLRLSSGDVKLALANVPDWSAAPIGATAEMTGAFDVAKLLVSAKDFVTLPEGTQVSATATFDFKITGAKDVQNAALNGQLADLKVTQPGLPPVEEKQVAMSAVAALRTKTVGGMTQIEQVRVEPMTITSGLLNVDAKATVSDLAAARLLVADGTIEPDFDKIGPLVAAMSGKPVELSGKQKKPFSLKTSLAGKDWQAVVRETLASAGVYIARAKFMGIETGPMDIPMNAKDGLATIRIQTTVSGGTLLAPLTLDTTGPAAVVSIPKDTSVMARIGITNAMADEFLSRASPIFKGAVVTGGSVGLTVRQMNVTMNEQPMATATFDGDLALSGITMKPAGFLATILDVVKLGGTPLVNLPDQSVTVTLKDGRFHQSPLLFNVGGYALKLSGSVGIADTSLDMMLEVPVTRELLGGQKDLFELLKDETIKVPIKGAAASPAIGKDILKDNLSTLVRTGTKKLLEQKGKGLLEKGLKDIFK